jgi:hypothetical protein
MRRINKDSGVRELKAEEWEPATARWSKNDHLVSGEVEV